MASHSQSTPKPTTAAVAPPSLNVYKKVAVIRKPSDSLTYLDAEGSIKSVSAEQLGDAISHAVSKSHTHHKDHQLFFRNSDLLQLFLFVDPFEPTENKVGYSSAEDHKRRI